MARKSGWKKAATSFVRSLSDLILSKRREHKMTLHAPAVERAKLVMGNCEHQS